jgi:YbgC/YbaW family acyl-CoA thioester hydrolase
MNAAAPPQRADYRFFERLRVRWAEVDMQSIVFNGHYLMYCDTAVAGYWRALALPYHAAMESLEGDLYVRKATVEYWASARYDELLDVGVRCERIGTSSMLLRCAVFRGPQALVAIELVYVFADPATQKSKPIPVAMRSLLLAFEAREPMVDVQRLTWSEARAGAMAIRQAVLVQELGIAALSAQDADDDEACHVLASNRLGMVVGAARLVRVQGRVGRIGRLAVLSGARGAGAGREMLGVLCRWAREQGLQRLELHSHVDATGLYRQAGFVPDGPAFDEQGVQHQSMVLVISQT